MLYIGRRHDGEATGCFAAHQTSKLSLRYMTNRMEIYYEKVYRHTLTHTHFHVVEKFISNALGFTMMTNNVTVKTI